MPTSIALDLLTNKKYSLEDARARRPPAQYMRAIMQHGIGCNIVDMANLLSFAYRGIASKLRVFVSPPTDSTKASNFIHALEENQEVWHEMMATPATPHRYFNPALKPSPSPYRPLLPSQYKVFLHYQSQQHMPQAQLSWQSPERPSGLTQLTQPLGPQRQYTPQFSCQSFLPKRQHYAKQRSRLLLAPKAIPRATPDIQLAPYITRRAADSTIYNPPRQPINLVQTAP